MFGNFQNLAKSASHLLDQAEFVVKEMSNGSTRTMEELTAQSCIYRLSSMATEKLGFGDHAAALDFICVGTSILLGYNLLERMHQAAEHTFGAPILRNKPFNKFVVLTKFGLAAAVAAGLSVGPLRTQDPLADQTFITSSNDSETVARPAVQRTAEVGTPQMAAHTQTLHL